MFEKNVGVILGQTSASDIILDIGGWARPFNRANYVLDIMPYENRDIFGSLGPEKELFTKDSWIIHDVSSKKPLPFGNKEIDFVICSHILEDIRDPIYLCSEIVRIGKRGYIEVPSRIIESTKGLEGKHYAGYYHHRWLVEIEGGEIVFRFKSHLLHDSWKFHFPKSYSKKLNGDERASYLFWEDSFKYKEVIQISSIKIANELAEFVRCRGVYPRLFYLIDNIKQKSKLRTIKRSILKKYSTLRGIVEKILGKKIIVKDKNSFWLNIPDIHSR